MADDEYVKLAPEDLAIIKKFITAEVTAAALAICDNLHRLTECFADVQQAQTLIVQGQISLERKLGLFEKLVAKRLTEDTDDWWKRGEGETDE
ncbi:MAG: hypothetical protein JSS27_07195 [Planctomycetes bacterium]|nr:hypothetical protein [Planctomycetota bacterium]